MSQTTERKVLDLPFKLFRWERDALVFAELNGKELRETRLEMRNNRVLGADSEFLFLSKRMVLVIVSTFTHQVREVPVGFSIQDIDFYPRSVEYVDVLNEGDTIVSLPTSQIPAQKIAVTSSTRKFAIVDVATGKLELVIGYVQDAYFFSNGKLSVRQYSPDAIKVYEGIEGEVGAGSGTPSAERGKWVSTGTLQADETIWTLFPLPDGKVCSTVENKEDGKHSFVAWDPETFLPTRILECVEISTDFDERYCFFRDRRVLRSARIEPSGEAETVGILYTMDGKSHTLQGTEGLQTSDFEYFSQNLANTFDTEESGEETRFFDLRTYKRVELPDEDYESQWGNLVLVLSRDKSETKIWNPETNQTLAVVPGYFIRLFPHSSSEKRLTRGLINDFLNEKVRVPIPKELSNVITGFIVPA